MAKVAIPIEIKTREFNGKLWLAMALADSGHKTALGYRNPMRNSALHDIKPDVFITKAAANSESRLKLFQKLNEFNSTIAVLDTEGGVIRSEDYYLKKRVSEEILQSVDLFFAWGTEPANIISKNTTFPTKKITVSGNPRFDLLHPNLRDIYSEKSDILAEKYGSYLLINTNFAKINHKLDKSFHISSERLSYLEFIMDKFIKVIPEALTINELDTIIIRPHPSENPEFYCKKFANKPSVVIDQSYDVRAWIMGAEVVLHNSCTTGIESAMLNRPTLAFEPDNPPVDSPRPSLPNTVSESVSSVNELLSCIKYYLYNNVEYDINDEQRHELKKYFANVDEPAVEKIVETINQKVSKNKLSYSNPSLINLAKIWVKKSPIAPVLEAAPRCDFERSEYSKQKFPGLTIYEVRERVSDFEAVSQIKNIKVEPVNRYHDIYWIYQENSN